MLSFDSKMKMRTRQDAALRPSGSGTWNVCAAIVVLGLALSALIQDFYHRSYAYHEPPGIPRDFPHYFVAGRLARLKPPENLLYYPPSGHRMQSWTELRTDATTPYGRPSPGLPDRFVTQPLDAPPFSALIMAPLSCLPWWTAYFVWQLLCAFLALASLYLAVRLWQDARPSTLVLTIVVVALCLYRPFRYAESLGNIDVLLLFLWVLGVFLFRGGRSAPSAFCFALGTAIKVSPIFVLPLLVMRRQWGWLIWYGVWSVGLLVVAVLTLGWQNHLIWAGQVLPALSCGIRRFENRSLTGLVLALSHPHYLHTFVPVPKALCAFNKALSASAYCAFLLWCWRRSADSISLIVEMTLLPLAVLLISPMSWGQYWVLTILPLTHLWLRTRERYLQVSRLDLVLLTTATLIFGSAVPEFVAQAIGPYAEVAVMGAWVASTLAILWVGMRMYTRCPADVEILSPAVAVAPSPPVGETL
jgi:hypothetical protein